MIVVTAVTEIVEHLTLVSYKWTSLYVFWCCIDIVMPFLNSSLSLPTLIVIWILFLHLSWNNALIFYFPTRSWHKLTYLCWRAVKQSTNQSIIRLEFAKANTYTGHRILNNVLISYFPLSLTLSICLSLYRHFLLITSKAVLYILIAKNVTRMKVISVIINTYWKSS